MIAGSLEVQLLANLARLQKDMNEAKGMVGGAMKHIESTVASAKAALGALGTGISAVAFVHWIKGAIDAADSMNDLRKSTSLTIEELAGLKLASKQSGSDLEGTAKAINKLSKEIGADAERFRALGITAKDPLEAFKQLSDILRGIEDPQLRAAVAAGALGKGWESAAPLLAEGSKKIGEMVEKGALLSGQTQQTTDAADEFNDRLAELETIAGSAALSIARDLLPIMTALAESMVEANQKTDGLELAFPKLSEVLRVFTVLGGNVVFVLNGIGREIGGISAQIAAAASGDFKGALAIGKMMKEDADKARTAFDAWQTKMMDAGTAAKAVAEETDAVTKTNENAARSFAKTGGGADKAAEAYESLIKSIREKIAVEEAAEKAGGKLSESQKLRVELESKLGEVVKKYGPAQRALVQSFIDQLIPMTERNRLAEEYAKLLDAEAKAIIDSEVAAMKSFADAQRQSVTSYGELIDKLEEEASTMLMTSEARERYIAIKKLDREYTVGLIATEEDYLSRLAEINAAFSKRDEAKKYFEEHTALWKDIDKTAHDTFISILNANKDLWSRMKETAKNVFFEWLWQMAARPILINVATQFAGSGVAQSVFGQGAGGVTNIANGLFGNGPSFMTGLSNISTAWSTFTTLFGEGAGIIESASAALAGMGPSFAAVLGPLGIAVGIASMLFKSGGGPKTEGNAFGTIGAGGAFNAVRSADFAAPFGDGDWGRPGADAARVEAMLAPISTSIYQAIRDLGGDATGLGIGLGYNTDPQGTAADNVAGTVRDAAGNEVYRNVYDVDRGQAGEAMAVEMQRVMLAALRATDLEDVVDTYLDTLDISSLSAEQAAAALKYVKSLSDTSKAMERLGFGAEALTPTLINAAGGIESLQAGLASYYDLFYSAEEKQAMAQADLLAQFEALNVAMPATKDEFRALVDGLDLTTGAGQEMLAQLLRLAPAFASAADAAADATAQVTAAAQEAADAQTQMWRDYHESMEAAERAENQARRDRLEEQRRAAEEAQRIAEQQAATLADLRGQLATWLDGLSLSDQLSPLTEQQKLDEAQRLYVEQYMRAQSGDLAAMGDLTRYADAYLTAQRDVSGFGGDYSAVYSAVRDQVDRLAHPTSGGSDGPITSGDIGELRTEMVSLRTTVARLLEIANSDNREQTAAIVSAITGSGKEVVTATTEAAVLTKKS